MAKVEPVWQGFLREDGRKGIRNSVLVVYLVECAHHVAREVASAFPGSDVQVIGFSGCYPNEYAHNVLERVCTHPNIGAVLLVSLGCECFDRRRLEKSLLASGRPAGMLVIQDDGGTRKAIANGKQWVEATLRRLEDVPRTEMSVPDLVVGAICGGSDATSGITANPAIGRYFDLLVESGGAAIFEEPGELLGCEAVLARRAATPELGEEILRMMEKTERYYRIMGHGSFAAGNAVGGLTTIEEKSAGSYAKSGSKTISGLLKPGVIVPRGGLYLLDVIPDGEPRFGFPNINDNAEIIELISCGSHVILFATGRGSVVGSAISPVIKVCGNPETYRRMEDDMDVNAGKILEGQSDLDTLGRELFDLVVSTAAGERTRSEELGHREFSLEYKSFEPAGPSCLPA